MKVWFLDLGALLIGSLTCIAFLIYKLKELDFELKTKAESILFDTLLPLTEALIDKPASLSPEDSIDELFQNRPMLISAWKEQLAEALEIDLSYFETPWYYGLTLEEVATFLAYEI